MNPPPPGLTGPEAVEERVTTTFAITRDQWSYLRRAAVDLASERGGRPDARELLREILQHYMVEDLRRARVAKRTAHGRVTLHPAARDRFLPELLEIPSAAPMSADEFRRIRSGLGLTQKDMAERLGKDVMTLSRWERGVTRIKPVVALLVRQMSGKTK